MNDNINDQTSKHVNSDLNAAIKRAKEILAKSKADKEMEQAKKEANNIQPATINPLPKTEPSPT